MPRYEADTDVEKVRDLISEYQITEPVAVDNEHKLKMHFRTIRDMCRHITCSMLKGS